MPATPKKVAPSTPGRGISPKPTPKHTPSNSKPNTPLTLTKIAFGLDEEKSTPNKRDRADSDASSDLSNHDGEDYQNERLVKYQPSTQYTQQRLKAQKDTYENSLEEVMDFIDDYPINLDIIHAIQASKQKRFTDKYEWLKDLMKKPEAKFALHMVKVVGIWRFTLHEMVIFEPIEAIDRRIQSILSGNKGLTRLLFGKRLNLGLLNQYDPDGHTPLSIAVKTNREDVVYSLVSAQASPDIPDEDTGRTPLFYAVANRYRKIVKMLMDAGADVSIADHHDVTPLMMACINKEVKIVKHLIREGAKLDVRDRNGWSSLHYAAYGGSYDVCMLLLTNNVDYSAVDANKRSATDIAKYKGNHAAFKLLGQRKAKSRDKTSRLVDGDEEEED